jgi:hypothetical protein
LRLCAVGDMIIEILIIIIIISSSSSSSSTSSKNSTKITTTSSSRRMRGGNCFCFNSSTSNAQSVWKYKMSNFSKFRFPSFNHPCNLSY